MNLPILKSTEMLEKKPHGNKHILNTAQILFLGYARIKGPTLVRFQRERKKFRSSVKRPNLNIEIHNCFVYPRYTKERNRSLLFKHVSVHSGSNWNLAGMVFVEGRKPDNPEKNLSEQGENQQQTRPTCDAWSENRAWVTLAGGERFHYYITAAPLTIWTA